MALQEKKIMPPPWLAHREIERYSIGWRMGYGEDYIVPIWRLAGGTWISSWRTPLFSGIRAGQTPDRMSAISLLLIKPAV